jgi:shikimate kinase
VRNLAALAAALRLDAPRRCWRKPAGARELPVVALLGLRGAGKSAIGKRLARRLRVPFVELDQKIEDAAGLSLGEIFALHGEEYYRRLEREARSTAC